MTSSVLVGGLHVNRALYDFVEKEVLSPAANTYKINVESNRFWAGLERAIRKLGPDCDALLQKRESLQRQIDHWHLGQKSTGAKFDPVAYKEFLYRIGYLVDQGPDFSVIVSDVDAEISSTAGPQLVVPLTNARFALNAANARWGSLFDALYSSDVVAPESAAKQYDPKRGLQVIARAVEFLDATCPLAQGSYANIQEVTLAGTTAATRVEFKMVNAGTTTLKDPSMFKGYSGSIAVGAGQPSTAFSILLCHNDLHIDLLFDRSDSRASSQHPSALKDVILESALSTIQDCEDSVAVVDAEDKVHLYRNWLGLMYGSLSVEMGAGKVRELEPDRRYKSAKGANGEALVLPGRSLMLIRNVGHHMYTDIVTLAQTNQPTPEGFLDAFVTTLIGLIDIQRQGRLQNSRTGSFYVVKPKQHGPEEVQLTNRLFDEVEQTLGLPRYTVKLGLMDEERRTTANLKACIREAQRRTIFVNTGFLDRTGDEIHTSFEFGPFARKDELKKVKWIDAYEKQNVMVCLLCGMKGKGQIGKGMWAEPDGMREMLEKKITHVQAGATTAWVPSPKAATLHALHYHQVEVKKIQESLLQQLKKEKQGKHSSNEGTLNESPYLDDLLTIPIATDISALTEREIQQELDNNVQGLLGYVVRWIDQGVGCSKVPNIHGVGLMEDRATLRISAQHIANWLHHQVVSEGHVFETMRHMAGIVDKQNAKDPNYLPMESRPFSSIAFQAALDLVFNGHKQPNGYTEFILHARRREAKRAASGQEEPVAETPANKWSKM